MTTEHNNFLTVISKEVALQYQTAANLLNDAISDSIPTICNSTHLLRLSYLVRMIELSCADNKVDQVMSSFGFQLHVKVYERPGISAKNQQTFCC